MCVFVCVIDVFILEGSDGLSRITTLVLLELVITVRDGGRGAGGCTTFYG